MHQADEFAERILHNRICELGLSYGRTSVMSKIRCTKSDRSSEMHYYGHFYRLEDRLCRSTLEIVSSKIMKKVKKPSEFLGFPPDVVVVMMNPGSSYPINKKDGPKRSPEEIGRKPKLTKIHPDKAQESIVALMECKKFEHVRVLNLSDVRETRDFPKLIASDLLPRGHTIFCEKRRIELQTRLDGQSVVVAGWRYCQKVGQLGWVAYDTMISLGLQVHGWQPRIGFAYPHPKGDTKQKMTGWLRGVVRNWSE